MSTRRHPATHTSLRTHAHRSLGLDRNPLCRAVDRTRSRLALALALLLAAAAAVGAVTGALAFQAESHAEQEKSRHRHAVTATTVGPAQRDDARSGGLRAHAVARWDHPVGPGSGTITVPAGTPAGTAVKIHLGDAGIPAAAARGAAPVLADAGAVGLGAATGLAAFAIGGYALLLRAVNRRAERIWEPDWERVEPLWSHRR
ncbi:Rv1733c family protein [Kitasatospora sp. NPDC054939]